MCWLNSQSGGCWNPQSLSQFYQSQPLRNKSIPRWLFRLSLWHLQISKGFQDQRLLFTKRRNAQDHFRSSIWGSQRTKWHLFLFVCTYRVFCKQAEKDFNVKFTKLWMYNRGSNLVTKTIACSDNLLKKP